MIHSTGEIKVGLDFGNGIQPVGRLAIRDRVIYFEYDPDFIQKGMEISPFRLRLQNGIIELPASPFEGLAGVFNDSLPDGWGRLLFDRMARSQGILLSSISPLDRLAQVGLFGMGALVYEPDYSPTDEHGLVDLDHMATQSEQVLTGASKDIIKELLALNGSSAGARPKALIGLNVESGDISYGAKQLEKGFEPWLVKFPNSLDGYDAGSVEYTYSLMAKEAGVLMPETLLLPSQRGSGYFAVKRFDREGNKRLHMHTASGLLHSDFRVPALDYEDLLNLTGVLTKDIREVEKMYRLAVFNVLAYNRDDHAKNFSFLMNEHGEWKLAPAYDLTFSNGLNGEQSMMVMGEGKNPTAEHLTKLGMDAKLSKKLVEETIQQTKDALSRWADLSKEYEVEKTKADLISKFIS